MNAVIGPAENGCESADENRFEGSKEKVGETSHASSVYAGTTSP
jgi:hypothetical protein